MKQRARRRHAVRLMAAVVQRHKIDRMLREFDAAFAEALAKYTSTQRAFVEALKQTVLRSIVRAVVGPIVAQFAASLPGGGSFGEART